MQIHRVTPSFKLVTLKRARSKAWDYFTLQRYSNLRLIIHLIIHLTDESVREKWGNSLHSRLNYAHWKSNKRLCLFGIKRYSIANWQLALKLTVISIFFCFLFNNWNKRALCLNLYRKFHHYYFLPTVFFLPVFFNYKNIYLRER